jgi:hypothetical protein
MTQDEIIEMARQAEFVNLDLCSSELERFAKLVAEHEREACAKVCDAFQARDVGMQPAECAGAIRARGQA